MKRSANGWHARLSSLIGAGWEGGRVRAKGEGGMRDGSNHSTRLALGLLWVVYNSPHSSKGLRAREYVAQVLSSAQSAERVSPDLPRALSTNLPRTDPRTTRAFHMIVPIPSSLPRHMADDAPFPSSPRDLPPSLRALLSSSGDLTSSLRDLPSSQRARSRRASPWLPRLLALASSPFDLTLEIDASTTLCSPHLLPALQREHRYGRFDLAVNFEASALAPPNSASAYGKPPSHVAELLPHNFALLVRKGRGWAALLRLWIHALQSKPDDQAALQAVLQYLARSRWHLPTSNCSASFPCLRTQLRVWRLSEQFLGFKSADKRMPGWRMLWPR
ncbi:MAG: hypothetical protein SGPRY_002605, partial [Prymnesium sp.]